VELASRLSYFLDSAPGRQLLELGAGSPRARGSSSRCVQAVDPGAQAVTTNFAEQAGLRNRTTQPDVYLFPDWDQNLTRSDAARDAALLQQHHPRRPRRDDLLKADPRSSTSGSRSITVS
jgi:hypothetical protein